MRERLKDLFTGAGKVARGVVAVEVKQAEQSPGALATQRHGHYGTNRVENQALMPEGVARGNVREDEVKPGGGGLTNDGVGDVWTLLVSA